MLSAINASSTEVPLRDAYLPSIDSVFALRDRACVQTVPSPRGDEGGLDLVASSRRARLSAAAPWRTGTAAGVLRRPRDGHATGATARTGRRQSPDRRES
jgi:hypothetical protein